MNPLPPIPTPPGQRWRDFKIQVVPAIVFVAVLAAVVIIWRDYVAPPTLIGQVEILRENVTSPKPGQLTHLNVESFQQVKAGDEVAFVVTTDPKILTSTFAVIQAEINLLRVNLEPLLGRQRFTLSFDRARLDWMQHRTDLATARVNLRLAESVFRRTEELFKEKIVSEKVFDEARLNKEKFLTEVEERARLVAEQEKNLELLRLDLNSNSTQPLSEPAQNPLQAAIGVQEEKLRLAEAELSPIPLRVPMNGMVSMVYRRSGETVMAGEPILTISAQTTDRIIGYLRQPITIEPRVGMDVEVRSRSLKRQVGHSKILQVGAQMETINAMQIPFANPYTVETGLPILCILPAEMKLLPGELVDLTLKFKRP